jgi:hypothetical protein
VRGVFENDITKAEGPVAVLQALEREINDLLRVGEGRRSGITDAGLATVNACSVEWIAVVPFETPYVEPGDAAGVEVWCGRDDVNERVVVGEPELIVGAVGDAEAGDVD